MIDYPENFPQPSTNFSSGIDVPTIRTGVSNGIIEQFGRFSTSNELLSLSWTLSEDELSAFEEWFNETLVGGVLIWGLLLPNDGAYEIEPVRFVGGSYSVSHKAALWWNVTAQAERLLTNPAPANRTLPVPQFGRLQIDPIESQALTLAYRDARLTVRPDDGSTTTLRIYPPTSDSQYIYFGINNQGDGDTLITSEDVDPLPTEPIPDFPTSLPAVNQTFSLDAERNAARIEMESGHPRQYAGLETTVKKYKVEWYFDLEQLQTFQQFFFETLKAGSSIFWLNLPVDGQFIPVRVRIIGGQYAESYVFHDTFRVSLSLDRIVDQTVNPSEERPWPQYYSPLVQVTENIKVHESDEGTLYVVNPAEGETIKLHIYDKYLEFGLWIIGLGNVLVTRGPFLLDIGELSERTASDMLKPTATIKSVYIPVGSIGTEHAETMPLKVVAELKDVVVDVGSVGTEYAGSEILKPASDLLDVLVDVGSLGPEHVGSEILKPQIIIDTP